MFILCVPVPWWPYMRVLAELIVLFYRTLSKGDLCPLSSYIELILLNNRQLLNVCIVT